MTDNDPMPPPSELEEANSQMALHHKLSELQREKDDLQLMLDMAIEHSDTLLDELRQEKDALMQLLESRAEYPETGVQTVSQFQLVADALPVGLVIARVIDGYVLYGNTSICELLGVSAKHLRAQRITDFCHSSADRQQLVSAMLNQQTFHRKLNWLQPDESALITIVSLQPFVFEDEATVLMMIQTEPHLS